MKASNRQIPKLLPFFILFLFISPVLISWVYFFQNVRPVSRFLEFFYDPEFAYLMNSLAAFKGHTYVYMDHPGTPLEILGTIFYAAMYPFLHLGPQDFILYNLRHPGIFLSIAHTFLLLASIVCAVYFFLVATPHKGLEHSLVGAALATMYFAIHPQAFSGNSTWSHNFFAFPFGTLLLLFLFHTMAKNEQQPEIPIRSLVIIGAGAGILTAITVYLGAWVIGIMSSLLISSRIRGLTWAQTVRPLAIVGLGCLASFVLVNLPILSGFQKFSAFVSGRLAHANATPINEISVWARLGGNSVSFYKELPVLSALVVSLPILVAVLFFLRRDSLRDRPGIWGFIGGVSLQLVLLALFLLDNYRARYFISAAAIVPVLVLALLRLPENRPWLVRAANGLLVVLVTMGLIVNLTNEIRFDEGLASQMSQLRNVQAATIQDYASASGRKRKDLVIIQTIGSSSPCYSLWFGNRFAGYAFDSEIAGICRRYRLYGYWAEGRKGLYWMSHFGGTWHLSGPHSIKSLDWDLFLGCEQFLLSDQAYDSSQYRVKRLMPLSKIQCGQVEGDFVAIYRK